jgi:D-alanyl-lipoteichoic acid acyltransferase DltB (MBOAT superfamily)
VRFPLNFNSPYKAQNIQDFWRRWHISLSTWLRDYLYIPPGGNRRGESRTVFNLMVTMLLGGLWHGANWTFVVWGGLHGAALALTRRARSRPTAEAWWRPLLGVVVTFHFVCFAWVFFRSENFDKAWAILRQLSQGTHYVTHLHALPMAVLACGLVLHWLPEVWYQRTQQRFIALPAAAQGLALGVVALVLREMSNAEAVPFVYFQF